MKIQSASKLGKMPRNKFSKLTFVFNIIIVILLALAAIFYVASRYKNANFHDAQIDEIIFYFSNGLANGQTSSFGNMVQDNILLGLTVFFLLLLPVIDFYRNRIILRIDLSFLGRKKKIRFNPSNISTRFKLGYAIVIFLVTSWMLLNSFGVFGYIRSLSESSQLYEQYYQDPATANLVFPEKKRNLIFIYLESMENTLASKQNGGQSDTSLIPELEALAIDPNNVSFSHQSNGIGGSLSAHGTTWTAGSMTAHSSGIPLKILAKSLVEDGQNDYGKFNLFLPGAHSIGDILKEQNYNQTFLMGSDATFGGRDKLLSQHGDFVIKDYVHAKEVGAIAEDYSVWWGFEDKKLFEFAKTELSTLSQSDRPFNLQLLTVDTHFTDGYLDETCPADYLEQYDNVYACSSRQVGEFVDWVQKQPFAENTAIVIVGDHLGMQTSYYDHKIDDPTFQRTAYNVFINPAVSPVSRNERRFSSLDVYPSTLAAMGVAIEGDKLGLGVNLFSESQTLIEQLGGIDELNNELAKRSQFYERSILVR